MGCERSFSPHETHAAKSGHAPLYCQEKFGVQTSSLTNIGGFFQIHCELTIPSMSSTLEQNEQNKQSSRIPRNVLALGWVSFFTDLATEMLYPVMSLFLVGTLNAPPVLLGLIDGLAEGVSSGLRWIGGALSDRFGRRKPFVVLGYTLSALSKPAMGLAQLFLGWPIFLAGRVIDRLGKSIRTSARDALIADSTPPELRGAAFGLHRAMDTCGAVVGPLATLVILIVLVGYKATFSATWSGSERISQLPLQWLFFAALVPGLISAAIASIFVAEIRSKSANPAAGPPPIFQSFPRSLWMLILANAVFSLGNSSDSFLILRSSEAGAGFAAVVLMYVVFNVVCAAFSAPLGSLSDRIGRKPVVACGWTIYALVYAGFAVCKSPLAPWILWGVYGLYQAFSEGVAKAMVADLVPSHQRGGAIGLFYTASGVCQLIASVVTGLLWKLTIFDGRVLLPFALGAVFALAGAISITMVPTPQPVADSHSRDSQI